MVGVGCLWLALVTAAAGAPHGRSNIAALDTRVVFEQSESTSGTIELDTRDLAGVLRWGESAVASLDTGGSAGIPMIEAVVPEIVPALDGRQWVTLRGDRFLSDAVVFLRTGNEFFLIPTDRTERVSSREMRVFINVTSVEAEWLAFVINPGGILSAPFGFSVGAPEITPVGTLDFGAIEPGQIADRSFIVRNRGGSEATLTVAVAAPFGVVNGPFDPVPSGGEQSVTVRYAPAQMGQHDRTVVFNLGSRSLSRSVAGRAAVVDDVPQGSGITGTVMRDTVGGPAATAGARVSLFVGDDGFTPGRVTQTDGDGRFVLNDLTPGSYQLVADPPDALQSRYAFSSVAVTVPAEGTIHEDLVLPLYEPIVINDPMKLPVVLVRGYGKGESDENAYWSDLRVALIDRGLEEVWDPNEDATGDDLVIDKAANLVDNATALFAYIQDQLVLYTAEHNRPPASIRIVAHSMGGLITRQFLHQYDDAMFRTKTIPPVTDVIMLGTPHAGSPLANVESAKNMMEELWGDSSLPATRELRPSTRRNWGVYWPNARGVRLRQLAGNTGAYCGPDASGVLVPLSRILRAVSPADKGDNDGVVTVASSKGLYIAAESLNWAPLPVFTAWNRPRIRTEDVLRARSSLHSHRIRSLNHDCIKTDDDVLEWIGNVMQDYLIPPGGPISPASLAETMEGMTVSLADIAAQESGPEAEDSVSAIVLYERHVVPAGTSLEADMLIDVTSRAELMVSQSSTTAVLRVYAPGGTLTYQSHPEMGTNLVSGTFAEGDSIWRVLSLPDPEAGTWRVELDAGTSEEPVEVDLMASVESPLTLEEAAPQDVHPESDIPVSAGIVLDGDLLPASGLAVDVISPAGAVTNVVMQDDGIHGDGGAGDGLFGALLPALIEPGDHQLIFRAEGVHPQGDIPYRRVRMAFVTVSSTGGFVVGVQGYEAIVSGENGFADAVRVDVLVHVDEAGNYSLSGHLEDADADAGMQATTRFSRLEAGTGLVSLLFTAHDLPGGAVYGPFIIRDLRLTRHSPQDAWIGTFATGETVQAHMYSPHARRIRFGGDADFGDVRIGDQAIRELTVHNDGWHRLAVSSLSLPPGFEGGFSGLIQPGESASFPVTFTPDDERDFSGVLEAESDAEAGDGFVPLRAVGLPVAIPYLSWADDAGIPGDSRDPGHDASGDGIANLIAYAFNIDPLLGVLSGYSEAMPSWAFGMLDSDAPFVDVEYRLYKHAVEIALQVQFSTTLHPDDWELVTPESIVPLGPDPITGDPRYRMRIRIDKEPRLFIRLGVAQGE